MTVGRLGEFDLPAGFYLYVGSAMGPGGLSARLTHHCRQQKKRHWHIDYLRNYATIQAIWYQRTDKRLECRWAMAALSLPGAVVPVPGFGSSDCNCPAHLVHLESRPDAAAFAELARVPQSQLDIMLYESSP